MNEWKLDQTCTREKYKAVIGNALTLTVQLMMGSWRANIETGVWPGVQLRREFPTKELAMLAVEEKAVKVIRAANKGMTKLTAARNAASKAA
jgi:hypothetical protein